MNLCGKTVLVTGAGSGIGRATALAMAAEGAHLVVCDKNAEALHEAERAIRDHSVCVCAKVVDVSRRDQMQRFSDVAHAAAGPIDVLVNNAGVYLAGSSLHLSIEDWEWVVGVNLWGMVYGCHFFLPPMVDRGKGGHVVNLTSMFGYWTSPEVIGYLTTKFAAHGFSEALREDLRPYDIRVSTVCPGMIQTGLVQSMRIRNAGDVEAVRSRLARLYRWRNYTPERVASVIVRAVVKERSRVELASPESRLVYRMERLFPWISRFVARKTARHMFRVDREREC